MIENITVFYNNLPDGHLLKLLHDEHESIKYILDELERELQSLNNYSISDDAGSVIEKLKILTANLLNAEPHHQREEDILFEAMKKSGISGPTSAMKTEHVGFREYKDKLKNQIDNINNGEFKENKSRIRYTATGLIGFIRGHIEKEENILYPMAFQTLKEPELWQELSQNSEKRIGPCHFQKTS